MDTEEKQNKKEVRVERITFLFLQTDVTAVSRIYRAMSLPCSLAAAAHLTRGHYEPAGVT